MSEAWRLAASARIRGNALRIALFVGIVLNLVNQGGALLRMEGVSWDHVALNFLVPYAVATYSAVRNQLGRGDDGVR